MTISGNTTGSSGHGGGVLNTAGGVFGINNGTIASNATDWNGGGVYSGGTDQNGQRFDDGSIFEIWNTIVAGNSDKFHAGPDCLGNVTSFGYILVGIKTFECRLDSSTGDIIGNSSSPKNPLLGELADYGGPTPTHSLYPGIPGIPGSPAIDAGNPDQVREFACAEYDQRFLPRPKDGPTGSSGTFAGRAVCDIGAYEYGAPKVTVRDASVSEGHSGIRDLVFRITLGFPHVARTLLDYRTSDGTARAGSDYRALSGSITFEPGETVKTVAVKVIGDRAAERNETLFFVIGASPSVRIVDNEATGTILNDD